MAYKRRPPVCSRGLWDDLHLPWKVPWLWALVMRRFGRIETGCFVAVWLLLLAAGRSRLLRDPGTFWHTVVGQDVRATGQLPRVDRFSFTFDGQSWIASNWLGESMMAAVHSALGWD